MTAATHDPAIATALLAKPEVADLLIGGPRSAYRRGSRRPDLGDVEALRPDLGSSAFARDPVGGIAAFDPEDAEIKRAIRAILVA